MSQRCVNIKRKKQTKTNANYLTGKKKKKIEVSIKNEKEKIWKGRMKKDDEKKKI